MIGNLAFFSSLPFVLSFMGIGIWLVIIVLGSIAASAYSASKASKLTIRETLTYI